MNNTTARSKGNASMLITLANGVSRISLAGIAVMSLIYSGCAMCCGPYDYHYPTFGGTVQRADPVWGRVGSLYSDPGPFGGPSADYNLTTHDSTPQSSDDFYDENDDLEPLDDGGAMDDINDADANDNSDVLPPPASAGRPGPDEATSYRRPRNQSRRAFPRWR